MPFKSPEQEKYLRINEPEVYKKFKNDEGLDEEIEQFFRKNKEKAQIDPELQRMIDIAKDMTTWELINSPPWDYEEDFSPDLIDVDIDVKTTP